MEPKLIDGAISAEQKLHQEHFNERLPIHLLRPLGQSVLTTKSFVFRRSPGDGASPYIYPARARSALARRACALRALGLLLADGTPTGGRGEDFLSRQPDFFTETAVTSERKVEKSFPRWEINLHAEG